MKKNCETFGKYYQQRDHNTNKNNIVAPYVRLHRSYNGHKCQQYILFNKLSLSPRNGPLMEFKFLLRNYIKHHAFYDRDEHLATICTRWSAQYFTF